MLGQMMFFLSCSRPFIDLFFRLITSTANGLLAGWTFYCFLPWLVPGLPWGLVMGFSLCCVIVITVNTLCIYDCRISETLTALKKGIQSQTRACALSILAALGKAAVLAAPLLAVSVLLQAPLWLTLLVTFIVGTTIFLMQYAKLYEEAKKFYTSNNPWGWGSDRRLYPLLGLHSIAQCVIVSASIGGILFYLTVFPFVIKSILFVGLSLLFGIPVFILSGRQYAGQATEKWQTPPNLQTFGWFRCLIAVPSSLSMVFFKGVLAATSFLHLLPLFAEIGLTLALPYALPMKIFIGFLLFVSMVLVQFPLAFKKSDDAVRWACGCLGSVHFLGNYWRIVSTNTSNMSMDDAKLTGSTNC